MLNKRFVAEESGQGMVEYGLILALLVMAGLTGLTLFGQRTHEMYDNPIRSSIVKALGG